MTGKFIVFEGIDGAGKTTQVNLLAEKLEKAGKKPYLTAEPTTLPSGKEPRRVPGGEIKKSA
jgi:dTMP kinase